MGGRITALKVQKRNRKRVNVHIDGQFAFGLAAIEAMKLTVGQHLDDAEIARLKEKDQIEVVYEQALNFITYRPRSIAEVRRRLMDKGSDESSVDQVIGRLTRSGLLGDEAFARFWLENRDMFKPRSKRALRYELRRKGVADSIIDKVLIDYDENDAAFRAGLARAQKLARRHDLDTIRPKLLAFLNRRGFSYDVARDTVHKLLAELDKDGADTL